MAKIPRYIQDKIASQAVGTPGLDQSANILSEATANATNQLAYSDAMNQASMASGLANIAGNAIKAIAGGIRLQQIQQRQLNQGAINKALYDFDEELTKSEDLAKRANINNPTAVSEAFRAPSEIKLQAFLQNLESNKANADVIRAVGIHGNNLIKQRSRALTNWGYTEAKNNLFKEMDTMEKNLPAKLGNVDSVEELVKNQNQVADYALRYSKAGAGDNNVIGWSTKISKESAREFLKKQAEFNPKDVSKLIEHPDIKSFELQPSDIVAIKNRAEGRIKELEADAARELRDAKSDYKTSLSERLMDTDGDKKDVQAAEAAFNSVSQELHELTRIPVQKRTELDNFKINTLAQKRHQLNSRKVSAENYARAEADRQARMLKAIANNNKELVNSILKSEREAKRKEKEAWVQKVSSGDGLKSVVEVEEAFKYATKEDADLPVQERLKRIEVARDLLEKAKEDELLDEPNAVPDNYVRKISALNALAKSVTAKNQQDANSNMAKFFNAMKGMFDVKDSDVLRVKTANPKLPDAAIKQAGKKVIKSTIQRAKSLNTKAELTDQQISNLAKLASSMLSESDVQEYLS